MTVANEQCEARRQHLFLMQESGTKASIVSPKSPESSTSLSQGTAMPLVLYCNALAKSLFEAITRPSGSVGNPRRSAAARIERSWAMLSKECVCLAEDDLLAIDRDQTAKP